MSVNTGKDIFNFFTKRGKICFPIISIIIIKKTAWEMLFLLCELFILIFRKSFFVVKFSHYNIYFSLRTFILIREYYILFTQAFFFVQLLSPFFRFRLAILSKNGL